jgi:hypothetical protein
MKILLGDFNAKVSREDIFKPTIGNESSHEISNDIAVRVVNFATSKNLLVKSTMFPHPSIHKYTWTSLDGQTHNQVDHVLIDRRRHSSILDKQNLCKVLQGKRLFNALYGTYTITLNDLKNVLQSSAKKAKEAPKTAPCDGFREQRRRKRSSNSEDGTQPRNKKAAPQTVQPTKTQAAVATKNYYATLNTMEMETPKEGNDSETSEVDNPRTTGRPPPLVLTSAINLIHLQSELKELVKGNFKLVNTKSGTRIISREMSDYSVIRTYLDSKSLYYFTFY